MKKGLRRAVALFSVGTGALAIAAPDLTYDLYQAPADERTPAAMFTMRFLGAQFAFWGLLMLDDEMAKDVVTKTSLLVGLDLVAIGLASTQDGAHQPSAIATAGAALGVGALGWLGADRD